MKRVKVLIGLILVVVAGLAVTDYASATPSASFHEKDDDVFDDWGIYRTRSFGEDGFYQMSETGFRPVIAFESMGEEAGIAYDLGKQIATEYPDQMQRAEAIFRFVKNRVNYASDTDQFGYDEFALNADELATTIDQDGVAYGDCEDSAVLLAIMYKGAGYRSAIVVAPGHTAALVYLPGYDKASAVFELEGESGWVWAEATGRKNPLGWVPKEFINVGLAAYEISPEPVTLLKPSTEPSIVVTKTGGGGGSFRLPPFFIIFGLLWLISLFRRKRRVR